MTKIHASPSTTGALIAQPTAGAHRQSLGVLPSEHNTDLQIAPQTLRHSLPNLATAVGLDTRDVAESLLMRTHVHITGLTTQHSHCVYMLEVDTGAGSTPYVVPKRFSEIRDFRAQLLEIINDKKSHCGHGTCAQLSMLSKVKFPRRQLRIPGLSAMRGADHSVAYQRVSMLEWFIQYLLGVYRMTTRRELRVCMNSRCVVLSVIQRFLGVTAPTVCPSVELKQHHVTALDTEYYMTRARLSEVILPGDAHSYPELAYSTLCGGRPSSLYPIKEQLSQVSNH